MICERCGKDIQEYGVFNFIDRSFKCCVECYAELKPIIDFAAKSIKEEKQKTA